MRELYISTVIAFFTAIISGNFFIPFLHKLKFGQHVRIDGPQSHLAKKGTPTMGGIIIIFAVIVSFLVSGKFENDYFVLIITTILFGSIGFADDYKKVVLKRSLGLKAKQKLFFQVLFALALSLYAYYIIGSEIIIPYLPFTVDLGLSYIPISVFIIVGVVNSVNLTDGLDGLATGVTIIVVFFFVFISIIEGLTTIAVFGGSIIGACLGFLRFNSFPAQVFMGDTGSLSLGAAVASLALLTKTHLFLPIVGGVFVIETLSVIIQVIYFRLTEKRFFKMSPLHHHFELSGWTETKVVHTFWGISIILAVVSLLIYLL